MSWSLSAGPVETPSVSTSGNTVVITLPDVNAGDSLAVGIYWLSDTITVNGVSCSGEIALSLGTPQENNLRRAQMAYLEEVTTGGEKTITITFSASTTFHRGGWALALTPSAGVGRFDAAAGATGSSTTPTVNLDTSVAGAVIIAQVFGESSTDPTAGAGFTLVALTESANKAAGEYDLDVGAAGTKTADFAQSSATWAISAVALFEETGSVGSSAGGGTATGISAATAASTGSAAGSSTAAFVAEIFGETFTFEQNLPAATLAATFSPYPTKIAEFNLPAITFESTLLTGPSLSGEFLLPGTSFAGEMLAGNALTAAFSLPAVGASAELRSDGIFSAEFLLPVARLTAQLADGQLFSSSPNLPVLSLVANMLQNATLSAAFNLPGIQLLAELSPALAATFRTWVLNTRRNALTEYDFEFTSYALFNGFVLGVSPAGVVILGTQGLDGSGPIAGRARLAKSDYGETHLKRVPRLYVGGEFAGDVLFRTIVDATGERTYRLAWNHVDGMQQRRVPIGKGPKARYWQYEIEGENGADFTIENVLAYPTGLRRRVM